VSDPLARRADYDAGHLDERDLAADPLVQLRVWLADAARAGAADPNAMVLATAGAGGRPSTRVVLLRGLDDTGLAFYTNTTSRKGIELAANGHVALLFFWAALQRQVRVEGVAAPVAAAEADAYFAGRPRASQLSAWASDQSEVVPDRGYLDDRHAAAAARYAGAAVPRPPGWGGYRVRPEVVELWQGRPSRLHDRLRYRRADGGWAVERLAP